MPKPVYSTGDVPSATEINNWMINLQFVRKTATESVTSSTTFQNDDALVLPVDVSTSYELSLFIRYDADSAADLKIRITLPAGAGLRGYLNRLHPTAAVSSDTSLVMMVESGSDALGGLGASTDCAAFVQGIIVTSATAGNCQLQWAQEASSATASRVWAESYMKLTRLA